jgi:cysteine-rich repeat protein
MPYCGDGAIWADGDGEEECDDANMSNDDACTTMCTNSFCGDGVLWQGMETCDDGNLIDSDACPGSCEPATCGDGFVQMGAEECDDGNMIDDDSCSNACEYGPFACAGGSVQMSISPGGNMVVCDDPNNATCEENMETLCPPGWGLCSYQQFINRNANWNYVVNNQTIVVAEIYCRGGGGAGHFTLGPYNNPGTLSTDIPLNCGYGSSRPNSCPANYGCNELTVQALCCAPTGTCGNGMVEGVEEACDDGNQVETDACLNNCTLRSPPGC